MIRVVAILETMWDWRGMTSEAGYRQAPRYFRINKDNRSGQRLYSLVGPDAKLLVTESCRELVTAANKHGNPDPAWLCENLRLLDGRTLGVEQSLQRVLVPFDVLLVCGKVAQATYAKCGYTPTHARVIEMPHPVARGYWTQATIAATAANIQGASHGH